MNESASEPAGWESVAKRYLSVARHADRIAADEMVNCLLYDAIALRASDIHVEPWAESLVVRFRVNGSLFRLLDLPLALQDRFMGRLKIMAELSRFEPPKPQEGHAPVEFHAGEVQLRISVFPTKRGEKAVVRIFDRRERAFKLEDLGFDNRSLEILCRLLDAPFGTVLFSGPTGSGKTTAMYASLCHLAARLGEAVSIATVEDPVEFSLPMVSQSEITPERDMTYPIALRSLMRQDPQIIMIGEIRDPETAGIALQAGLTGHLVLSSVHSPGAAGVFTRLIQMGVEPFVLASSVLGIIAMRLVPQNCPQCSEPYDPAPGLLRLLSPVQRAEGLFRRGTGCSACAFSGQIRRRPVVEVLEVTDAIRDAVLSRATTGALQQVAQAGGLRTLWQSGLEQVVAGAVPIELLVRTVIPDPALMNEDDEEALGTR